VKILFECASITPGESCGVETFLYSLIRGFQRIDKDELFINIPPGTRDKYEAVIDVNNVKLLEDVRYVNFLIGRVCVGILRRIGFTSIADAILDARRRKWSKACEKDVDIVLYPFHKGIKICHKRKPVILVMHDLRDLERDTERLMSFYHEQINKCKAIITSWPHPFQLLKNYFPEYTDKFYMIHFPPEPMPLEQDLKTIHLNRLLIYPSSNGIDKNHENLIKALGILKKQGTEKIRIICPGTQSKDRAVLLNELAKQNYVQDWISFIGFVPRDHIRWLYQVCSGVITTTKYEAFSGAVFEGFCYGKPIACSNIPPLKSLIDKMDVTVKYFNPDDPNDIAASIIEIIENPSPYILGSLNARQYLSTITQENTAKQYREIFQKVIKG